MSRSIARRIYADAFAKWPKQDLRPDYQLQDILSAAVDERYKNWKPAMEAEETLKARALQFLVQDKYKDRFKLQGPMLQPKSQPTYFTDLMREIEDAPRRTWLERLGKRLSGMIRHIRANIFDQDMPMAFRTRTLWTTLMDMRTLKL
ncbi:hypothetical protein E4U43_008324 [Claviceps pusilla]|uniref:Uncharacterized protein n=1 Tax=Claviceps pusilla TaxID=123648 RepID=A0A9P7NCY9_9HYPO|nr:hypothetical protein E4U43_008324 [Claviceps pusilla]